MQNYKEVEKGIFQSVNTVPNRKVDQARIREIIEEKSSQRPEQNERRKSAPPNAFEMVDR
jgi:hypothetical protein